MLASIERDEILLAILFMVSYLFARSLLKG
jgi:hypothetical protein